MLFLFLFLGCDGESRLGFSSHTPGAGASRAAFTGRPRERACVARPQQAEGGPAATHGLLCA